MTIIFCYKIFKNIVNIYFYRTTFQDKSTHIYFYISKLNLKEFICSQSLKYLIQDNLKKTCFREPDGVICKPLFHYWS
jgi:hypothetical protein